MASSGTAITSTSFSAWQQVRLRGSHEQELDFHANMFKLSLMTKHEDKIKPQSEHKPSCAMAEDLAPPQAPPRYQATVTNHKTCSKLVSKHMHVIISSKEWQWSCPSTPSQGHQGPICPTDLRHQAQHGPGPYWTTSCPSCPSSTTWRSTGWGSTACRNRCQWWPNA